MDNKINNLRGVRDILHNYFGFASVIITNYHLGPSGLDNNSPYPSPLRLLTYHYKSFVWHIEYTGPVNYIATSLFTHVYTIDHASPSIVDMLGLYSKSNPPVKSRHI